MRRYHLFEAFGVELEYMVVDRETLAIRPIVDELFHDVTGHYSSEVDRGEIAWSNEIVNHVVELKTNGPSASLEGLAESFQSNVRMINEMLAARDAMLLPGGSHPTMDPFAETRLWPHESREIYGLYDRIFDCRGHGWSNVQSTHINLPFDGDEEFERLHAAIRVVLPIMPAIAASTPVLDGKVTGFADARLEAYRHNQKRLPSLTGVVIPEQAFSEKEYRERIFDPIMADVRPFDTDGILDRHFVNSRGAIARFDRGSIEIRVLDIQECPAADLAIVSIIVSVLTALVKERWSTVEQQKAWTETDLSQIFLSNIRVAENAAIENAEYLRLFGMDVEGALSRDVWRYLAEETAVGRDPDTTAALNVILTNGSLATRIVREMDGFADAGRLMSVYRRLGNCLQAGEMFVP